MFTDGPLPSPLAAILNFSVPFLLHGDATQCLRPASSIWSSLYVLFALLRTDLVSTSCAPHAIMTGEERQCELKITSAHSQAFTLTKKTKNDTKGELGRDIRLRYHGARNKVTLALGGKSGEGVGGARHGLGGLAPYRVVRTAQISCRLAGALSEGRRQVPRLTAGRALAPGRRNGPAKALRWD